MITTRPVWPVGVPFYVAIDPSAYRDMKDHIVRVRADCPDAPAMDADIWSLSTVCRLPGPGIPWDDGHYLAGTVTSPRDTMAFTVSKLDERGRTPSDPVDDVFVKPMQFRGTVGDLVQGVALPDVDEAVAQGQLNALFYRHGWYSRDKPRLWVGVYTNCEGKQPTEYPGICHVLAKHPDVTFAVRLEVLHDSVVVATSRAWWRGREGGRLIGVTPFEGMLEVTVEHTGYRDPPKDDGKWSLRLTSDPETALRDFDSTRYWLGSVTAPLRVTDSDDWDKLKAAGVARAGE